MTLYKIISIFSLALSVAFYNEPETQSGFRYLSYGVRGDYGEFSLPPTLELSLNTTINKLRIGSAIYDIEACSKFINDNCIRFGDWLVIDPRLFGNMTQTDGYLIRKYGSEISVFGSSYRGLLIMVFDASNEVVNHYFWTEDFGVISLVFPIEGGSHAQVFILSDKIGIFGDKK